MYPNTPEGGWTAPRAPHPVVAWLASISPQQLLTGGDTPLMVGPGGHALSAVPARTPKAHWVSLAKLAEDVRPHPRLPAGYVLGEVRSRNEMVLLDPARRAVGFFDPRADGQLLELHEDVRGRGLGPAFLLSALEGLHDRLNRGGSSLASVMESVWQPGTFSAAGLKTTLAAHALALREAKALGHEPAAKALGRGVAPVQQLDPRPLGDAQLLRAVGFAAHTLPHALRERAYKEVMAVAKLMAPERVKLYRLVERDDMLGRPHTFMMKVGGEFYGGHRRAEQSQVAADIAAEFAGKQLALVWKPVRLDQLLGHKNFERTLAQSLLAHAERARLRELDRAPRPRGMERAR